MRTLLKVEIPVTAGSKATLDGTLAETVTSVFNRIKNLDASVALVPCMNQDELQAGVAKALDQA